MCPAVRPFVRVISSPSHVTADQVIDLHTALFVQGNPVTVKYALARMGLVQDMLRVPLVPMEAEYRQVVDRALESAGLLQPQQSGL